MCNVTSHDTCKRESEPEPLQRAVCSIFANGCDVKTTLNVGVEARGGPDHPHLLQMSNAVSPSRAPLSALGGIWRGGGNSTVLALPGTSWARLMAPVSD